MPPNCSPVPLYPSLLIAIAKDGYLKPTTSFPDKTYLPALSGSDVPMYGQDILFSFARIASENKSVGSTVEELKPKMRKLLEIFASGDTTGMSKRLFDAFLSDTHRFVTYFDDAALNKAAASHPNIQYFCEAVLSAPNSLHKSVGKIRIHQALKNANWDIKKIKRPTGLGVPAFNRGNKTFTTGDFDNGLGLMINGVQYVYVIATHYNYDNVAKKYCITLKFIFYDVFGLDDDDLKEYGASSDAFYNSNASIGITAWWQLQHQFFYAPLVTRIVLEKTYEAPAE